MPICAGLDIGSGAVKAVVMQNDGEAGDALITQVSSRIRRRDVAKVAEEVLAAAVAEAGVSEVHYVATTGEGEDFPFHTGHF
jgi:activator of 2-hydroxyglutaryl-CoA dehydratase